MSTEKPVIICTGMCNTKAAEIKYLAEQVTSFGGEAVIMDLSLGGSVDWADISVPEVLATIGIEQAQDVFTAPRATAIDLVGKGGATMALQLYEAGRLDGIISWAGSVGTTTVTHVMRALPFGVPKIMLTDMASADVSMWLGNKDIFIANPTAEQGINVVTEKIVQNACAGVVAMARVPDVVAGAKPLAAITSYGTTTPTVLRTQAALQAKGWDTTIFHAVGVGATMEDLIRSGMITALLDITPGELTNNLYNSPYGTPKTWEGERMTAAAEVGIPQIVVPGGLDQCAHGALSSLPQEYLDDFKTGRRLAYKDTQLPYVHNEGVTIMVPTQAEIAQLSEYMASKLNKTTGPTAFIIPMRGWSAYDQSEELATRERGWAEGNGDGPVWDPDAEHPEWSKRATLMLKVLQEKLDPSKVDLMWTDHHILDDGFADLLSLVVGEMIDGTWQPGSHRDYPGVLG